MYSKSQLAQARNVDLCATQFPLLKQLGWQPCNDGTFFKCGVIVDGNRYYHSSMPDEKGNAIDFCMYELNFPFLSAMDLLYEIQDEP